MKIKHERGGVQRRQPREDSSTPEAKAGPARKRPASAERKLPQSDRKRGELPKSASHTSSSRPVHDVAEPRSSALRRTVIELPGLPLDEHGRTPPQTLSLPEDVQSLLIEVRGRDDEWFVVDSLRGPAAQALVTPSRDGADALKGPQHSANPATVVMRGSSALLAPNNPGVSLTGGAWTFTAAGQRDDGAAAAGSVDVRVTVSSGVPKKRGRLPLNLYFTSDKVGYRAEDARHSAVFDAALSRLKQLYASAGIEVGPIRMLDSGPVETAHGEQSAAIVDASQDGGVTPEDLLKTTTEAEGVNVFLTEALYLDRGQVAGVSGSVPGPASPGSTSSGVIFSINAPLDQPQPFYGPVLGAVMAHEIGHYLGLSHTVEADAEEDRLPDTGDAMDSAGNVMFWGEIRADRHFSLSPEQAQVMLRHPLIE